MLKYLIVLLDKDSVSFCYYNNKMKNKSGRMPINMLKEIINYAKKNELYINFLYGKERLPEKHEKLIDSINNVKIIPFELDDFYDDKITILNSENTGSISSLKKNPNRIIILRLEKKDLSRLKEIFDTLIGKFKRLNLNLIDIQDYNVADIDEYEKQLEKISQKVISEYKKGKSIEINFLSDRLLLNKMNNCNAGIDHVTIAPNGKFYICPGFYHDDINDNIGDIEKGIDIKSRFSLNLNQAPICSVCDAFQCKRCIYLNKKITLEINTPSFQQCVLSHYERNKSKMLLDVLRSTPGFTSFDNIAPIPEINYVDPLKVLTGETKKEPDKPKSQKKIQAETDNSFIVKDGDKIIKLPKLKMIQRVNNVVSKSIEEFCNLSMKDMLVEIYKMQKEILKEFNNVDDEKITKKKMLKVLNKNGVKKEINIFKDFNLIYGKGKISYAIDEFVVVCLVKNGEHYIDHFIKHYKNLGARHIYFIDNCSTDDTILKIKKHSNASIYSTSLSFKDYECDMRNEIVRNVSKDRWCLAVDIDEFFDYPDSDRISMKQLIKYLNKYKYTGVIAYMLDMFSRETFIHKKTKHDDFVKTCCYYDISNIVKHDYGYYEENKNNQFENKYIKIYKGGIRNKIFGNNSPFFLIKHPLMFIDKNIIPFTTPHFCNKANLADITCVIKHYKFINSFFDKVKKVLSENSYPTYALMEYKMYHDFFQNNHAISFYSENSKKFNNINDLIKNQFISISDKFNEYANSKVNQKAL